MKKSGSAKSKIAKAARQSKHIAPKVISKDKGFRKTTMSNEKTGRKNQVLECLTCNKMFGKLCNVLDHVRTHANERPFDCSRCGQKFAQRGNRDRHEMMRVCLNRRHKS